MLPVEVLGELERLLGGDPATEESVLQFIDHKFKAKSLLHLSPMVAAAILERPADFRAAVELHSTTHHQSQ